MKGSLPKWGIFFQSRIFRDRCCRQTGICTSLINSNCIEGSKHSNIRQNWSIITTVAIAAGAHVLYQTHMELWSTIHYCQCVFCLLQFSTSLVLSPVGCVASFGHAPMQRPQPITFVVVDECFMVFNSYCIVSAISTTLTTAYTTALIHLRFARGMHFHLTCTRATSHT